MSSVSLSVAVPDDEEEGAIRLELPPKGTSGSDEEGLQGGSGTRPRPGLVGVRVEGSPEYQPDRGLEMAGGGCVGFAAGFLCVVL